MAQVAAVGEETKHLASSGSGLGGVSEGIAGIGHAAEETEQKVTLTRDSAGRLRNELGQFATDAEKAAAGLEDLGRTADGAGRQVDGAGKKTRDAGAGANDGGNGFNMAAVKITSMVTAALAAGPALAAIPALAGAAGGGMLALGGAFTGVVKTLHDYVAQQGAAAAAGASSAATAFSNAVAIRNGEQAIADAKQRAAQVAVTSAQQIASAQQALGDAERQAATAAESSADAVAAADRRWTDAQNALNQAQRDAVNVLKDVNLQAEGAANSVADAQNAVIDAQAAYDKAKGNSLLTDQQKKEALQALIDAQFRLKDAQQKAAEAQQAADDANKKGVDGSTAVVAAKQNVADAEHALMRAQEAQTNQAISSAESVAKAQQGVTDAIRNAAQQQTQAAQQVARAEQALADTRTQQALAAQSASVANNKFASDMAKLTQPGRDFVNTLLGMKGSLDDLSKTAQSATLPGFTAMLHDSSALLPTVRQGIKDMGSAIGGVAQQFGDLMKNSAFQGGLQSILSQSAGLAKNLGDGVVGMVGGIAKAASAATPITQGLGAGFQTLLGLGIPGFFQHLTDNAGGSGQALSGFLTLVSNLLGPVGTLASAVSAALAPALQVLSSPEMAKDLQSIASSLGSVLVALAPLITALAQGFAGALSAVAPLLSAVAGFIQDNQKWLIPLVGILAGVTGAVWLFNAALAANPLVLIAELIGGLVLAIIYAWDHFKGFRDFIIGAWDVIKLGFHDAISWIEGAWHTFTGLFDPSKWGDAVHHMWDWIKDSFKDAINMVIGWWNSISFTLPKVSTPLGDIGGGTIGVPHIPPLKALGGVGRGLTGIHDQGVELVNLPDGSVVMPHANTMSAMQGGTAGGGNGLLQLEWVNGAPLGDALAEALLELFRHHIRIRGGNGTNSVQAVLGQSF